MWFDCHMQFLQVPDKTDTNFIKFIYIFSIWVNTRETWECELGLNFDEHWWESALKVIHKTSICARLTLIMFKVVFRCHYSKTRLAQIFPNVVDVCDRCGGSPCNLTHMFFSCPTFGKLNSTPCLRYSQRLFTLLHTLAFLDFQKTIPYTLLKNWK